MKNRKWKKILSIVLAALLVVALLPVTVAASDVTDNAEVQQVTSVTLDEGLTAITEGDSDTDVDTTDNGSDTSTESGDSIDSSTSTESGNSTDFDTGSGSDSGSGSQSGDSTSTDSTGSVTDTGTADETGDIEDVSSTADSGTTEDSTDSSGTNTDSTDGTVAGDDEEILSDAAAAAVVEALIADLPTVNELETMSNEDLNAAYTQVNEAYDAYDALSEEGKALVSEESLTKLYDLLDYFNGQNNTLEETDKTLTVNAGRTEAEGETYTTIQGAINYISTQNDNDGWTINVEAGTYDRFSVTSGVDNLTISGAGDSTIIQTMVGTEKVYGNTDPNGIIVNASNFTLKNVKITKGTSVVATTAAWKSCAVFLPSGGAANGFTLYNATVEADDGGYGIFADNKEDILLIDNCAFNNLTYAIYYYNSSSGPESVTITNNTFKSCSFALFMDYADVPVNSSTGTGTVVFSENTIMGTSDLRCKVVIEDEQEKDAVTVTIKNNKLSYALIGTVNLRSSGECSDVLNSNEFINDSFYVDAIYPGKITVTWVTYQAPEDNEGYWVLTGIDGTLTYSEQVQAAIDEANASGSHTLNITGLDTDNDGSIDALMETFTAIKDCIYWCSGNLPNLSKSIVIITGTDENGNDITTNVNQVDAAAGDTVEFVLASRVPTALSNYIDDEDESEEDDEGGNDQTEGKTYELTFVDELNSYLTLDESSVVVMVGEGTDLSASDYMDEDEKPLYYTVSASDSSENNTIALTITIDLLALYTAGIIDEDDFGTTAITVTYSATLSEDAPAGSYANTAYVTYPEGTSAEDTAQVDAYGLCIYKYDLRSLSTDEDGETSSTPLVNAVFYLYEDEELENRIAVLAPTGEDGITTFTATGLCGTYYLVEVVPPTGYVAVISPIEITISGENDSEDGTVDHIVTVQVANAAIPQTGGMGTQPFVIAGIAILLMAGLVYGVTRRRIY